jgi:hypothetical protein
MSFIDPIVASGQSVFNGQINNAGDAALASSLPGQMLTGAGAFLHQLTSPGSSANTTNYNAAGAGANTSATAGAAASAPVGDPSTAAYYQQQMDQLNSQNGRLDSQLNTGLGNLTNSFNQQDNRLNQQKANAQDTFNTQNQQNMQNYANTRNGILSNTRATSNALQRLLGLNGACNSSAAFEQAPYAAGLQGSQNLNQAQQSFSNNGTALNKSWRDTQQQYSNALDDLNNQKYSQENSLRSSIAQTRANLLDQIASAGVNKNLALGQNYAQAQAARTPYQQQINSLLDSITGLGNQYANPVLKAADVNFTAPSLSQFGLGQQATIQNQTGAGAAGDINPSFLSVLAPKDKNSNQLGY